MEGRKLRHGYTTGACAAAATLGAALMLREQSHVDSVELPLPAGFDATFDLGGREFDSEAGRCFVVKDAGDDPDVTDGVEVHAEVSFSASSEITIEGGRGIGTVTKPGLAVSVGEPAVNPVPRRMILEALSSVFPDLPEKRGLKVVLSIPDGEERAKRTLNERLGILGGLSILGTSGVVRPISHKAWTDTLEVALDVALAAGGKTVVLSTGRTSEVVGQQVLDLPEESYVMMGDHVGYAMEACSRKKVAEVVLAAQFAKLVKIACGHRQTHVHSSRLDLAELAAWAQAGGLDGERVKKIECANTAREVYMDLGSGHPLVAEVTRRALARLQGWAPGCAIAIVLAGYDGRVALQSGSLPVTSG